ncbi:MAG: PTPA-CTERM sorting domain-containing protein [Limnothrix sp. RL_2_0]|nr:PTPA-CTERM sorting domain-containing protein [Limnothrix sp. RL_2_0]
MNVAGEDDGVAEGFFGKTDWDFISKFDPVAESGDQAAPTGGYNEILAIFKGGANTTLVGYLLDGTNIDWENPWLSGDIPGATGGSLCSTGCGISHISFYGRTGSTPPPVPTPAAVLPILGGLFGAASRRKKGESTEA